VVRQAVASSVTVTKSPEAFRTISEVAEDLDLPQHVLRFWETRFAQIKPMKRGGGRRYYRPDDVDLLRGIRHLLYGEGYTIRGVQRIFKDQGPRFVVGAGRGEIVGLPGRARGESPAADDFEPEMIDGGEAPHIEPALDDSDLDTMEGAPSVEIDRDDHEPDAAVEEDHGVVGATRRFVGRLMEGRNASATEHGLEADDVRRLQATLVDLLECKRLLDQAR
jgi:DNA-binding transcriptional MerR regulator